MVNDDKRNIGELPFFSNYELFLMIQVKARLKKVRVKHLILDAIEGWMQRHHGDAFKITGNTQLWESLKEEADRLSKTSGSKISVADVIEVCCASEIMGTKIVFGKEPKETKEKKRKGSIFDLNRDVV